MTSLFSRLSGYRPASREQWKIARDADRLIRLWGTNAYERATDLSSREDMGFIVTTQPGHWWSVRGEIARRTGRPEARPMLAIAADPLTGSKRIAA